MPKTRKPFTPAVPISGTADPAPFSQDLGEAPGSPAYFGKSAGAGGSAADTTPDFEAVPDTGIGTPPGSAEYWGVDPVPHAASHGPDGTALPLPTVGEEPGSPSYFGTEGGAADASASSSQDDVGEAPGSPAYFGELAGAGDSAPDTTPDFEAVPDTGIGTPPGSAEYWGGDAVTHEASRGLDGSVLPLPTVGEEPGSPSYFGTGGDAK